MCNLSPGGSAVCTVFLNFSYNLLSRVRLDTAYTGWWYCLREKQLGLSL